MFKFIVEDEPSEILFRIEFNRPMVPYRIERPMVFISQNSLSSIETRISLYSTPFHHGSDFDIYKSQASLISSTVSFNHNSQSKVISLYILDYFTYLKAFSIFKLE